ncbi:unnamed protein product, partial [Mesorhabditis spiculigera]
MDRILRGVIKYRQTVRKDLVKQFEKIRDNPNPLAVMFTCMDSRMLPTRFTQAAVGDMFVVRNAGNIVPDAQNYGHHSEVSVTTEPAALELAVKRGGIKHVLVCGHSDCKAMNLLYDLHVCPKEFSAASPMDSWVRKNGYKSIQRLNDRLHNGPRAMKFSSDVSPSQTFEAIIDPFDKLHVHDKLSQINVLQQIINIASHEFLKEYLESGKLFLHGMWFDIYSGNNYLFSKDDRRYVSIEEKTVEKLMAELEKRRCLGCGAFGTVSRESRDGRIVAVKRLKYSPHPTHLRREIEILESLCHPNIVEYIKYEEGDGGQPGNIVTEYCERGDLKTFIKNPEKSYSISVVVDWACEIFEALLHLERKEIFHRDIKPSNMLLGNSYEIKLCDFGLSKAELANNSCYGVIGTVRYLAPEAFTDHKNQQIYTYASDLYSAGLVLWECIERRDVFHETVGHQMLQSRICSGTPLERANCLGPVADLIEKCIRGAPEDRPSAAKAGKEAKLLKEEPFYRMFGIWPMYAIPVPEDTVRLTVIGRWGDIPEEEK